MSDTIASAVFPTLTGMGPAAEATGARIHSAAIHPIARNADVNPNFFATIPLQIPIATIAASVSKYPGQRLPDAITADFKAMVGGVLDFEKSGPLHF
jgi:hypothetical protein